jgi:hypothetical protein
MIMKPLGTAEALQIVVVAAEAAPRHHEVVTDAVATDASAGRIRIRTFVPFPMFVEHTSCRRRQARKGDIGHGWRQTDSAARGSRKGPDGLQVTGVKRGLIGVSDRPALVFVGCFR